MHTNTEHPTTAWTAEREEANIAKKAKEVK